MSTPWEPNDTNGTNDDIGADSDDARSSSGTSDTRADHPSPMLPKVDGAQSSDDVLRDSVGLSVRNGGGDDDTVRHIPIVADGKVHGRTEAVLNEEAQTPDIAGDADAPTAAHVFDFDADDDDADDASVDESIPYGTSYVVPTDPATRRDVIAHTHGPTSDAESDASDDALISDELASDASVPHEDNDDVAQLDGGEGSVDTAQDGVDEDIARERKTLWRNAAIVGVSVLAVFGLGYIVSDMRNGASEPSTIPETSQTQILMSSESEVIDEPVVADRDDNAVASTLRLPGYVSEVNSSSLAPSPEESVAPTRQSEQDASNTPDAHGEGGAKEAPSAPKQPSEPNTQSDNSAPAQPSMSSPAPSADNGGDKAPKRENTVININESREVAPGVKVALSDPHLVKNVGANRETLICANVAIANRSGKDVVYNADMWKVRTPKGSDLFPPVVNIESKNFVEGVVQNNNAIDAPLCFIYQGLGRYEFIYDDPNMEGITTWRATF